MDSPTIYQIKAGLSILLAKADQSSKPTFPLLIVALASGGEEALIGIGVNLRVLDVFFGDTSQEELLVGKANRVDMVKTAILA